MYFRVLLNIFDFTMFRLKVIYGYKDVYMIRRCIDILLAEIASVDNENIAVK